MAIENRYDSTRASSIVYTRTQRYFIQPYGPYDYVSEFGQLVQAMSSDGQVVNQNLLIGPNVNSGPWTPEMVWDTGFVDAYSNNLAYLAVEQCVKFL